MAVPNGDGAVVGRGAPYVTICARNALYAALGHEPNPASRRPRVGSAAPRAPRPPRCPGGSRLRDVVGRWVGAASSWTSTPWARVSERRAGAAGRGGRRRAFLAGVGEAEAPGGDGGEGGRGRPRATPSRWPGRGRSRGDGSAVPGRAASAPTADFRRDSNRRGGGGGGSMDPARRSASGDAVTPVKGSAPPLPPPPFARKVRTAGSGTIPRAPPSCSRCWRGCESIRSRGAPRGGGPLRREPPRRRRRRLRRRRVARVSVRRGVEAREVGPTHAARLAAVRWLPGRRARSRRFRTSPRSSRSNPRSPRP